jgi:hypothetical protein
VSPKTPPDFKLLAAFENVFHHNVYKHRQSTVGNAVAAQLYEDMFDDGTSGKFQSRILSGRCVVNVEGSTRGVKVRRGDGTFGAIVSGADSVRMPGCHVARGMVALTQIGAESKFVATAHLKQIDRVINDLTGSAKSLKAKSPSAITVGLAAVNYSEHWTGMEGARSFPVQRTSKRAQAESDETCRRLIELAAPAFDELILLRFRATNQPPFPFAWIDPSGIAADYGAALVRLGSLYETRF